MFPALFFFKIILAILVTLCSINNLDPDCSDLQKALLQYDWDFFNSIEQFEN